jgi:hypothetical protein
MSADAMRAMVVEAFLNDPFDGVIRLLGDAQRFGFALQGLTLRGTVDGIASATIAFEVPAAMDAQLVVARLARHPAVQRVEARPTGRARVDPPQAAAA